VTRNITVPTGMAIFFPILDPECSTLEGNRTTDAELRLPPFGFGMDIKYNLTVADGSGGSASPARATSETRSSWGGLKLIIPLAAGPLCADAWPVSGPRRRRRGAEPAHLPGAGRATGPGPTATALKRIGAKPVQERREHSRSGQDPRTGGSTVCRSSR